MACFVCPPCNDRRADRTISVQAVYPVRQEMPVAGLTPRPGKAGPIHAWRWLALLPVLCCLSCSGSDGLHTVQGKVLYKNQPVRGAVVTLHPQGADEVTAVRPVGLTNDDGTFTLTTGRQEGAPTGEYVVTVIWPEELARKGKKPISTESPDTRDRLRGAYADRATSRLKAEIKKGPNQLEPFRLR